jgi:hypothetical protein
MGVTHIRYLLDQWRRRWEILAALHALEGDKPAAAPAPDPSRPDSGEGEASATPGRPGQ